MQTTQPKKIRFAPFEVNFEQRELRNAGTRVPLQHKPFRILELLLRQPGALVSRQELAKELWPHLHVNFEHSLNSAVNTLRQALRDSPRESRFIETRSGLGYRFIAPIEPIDLPVAKTKTAIYNDYLQGRFFLNKMTSDGVQRAIGCFQSVINADPACALAQAGLADCYCQLALSGTVRGSDVAVAARQSAAAALSLNPDLAEAHVAMAQVRVLFDWDWQQAMADCHHAIELNPSLPSAHRGRALLSAARNRHDESLQHIGQAQDLDPLSVPLGCEHAWLLYLAGHLQEAVAQSWQVLTLEPSFALAQTILGLAYYQLGSFDEAATELENAVTCSDRHPAALASLAFVYAAAGLPTKAQPVLDELATQSQKRHVSPYWFALVYAGLGQRQSALSALQTAYSQHEPPALWLAVDPRLASLQTEPAFTALRKEFSFGNGPSTT